MCWMWRREQDKSNGFLKQAIIAEPMDDYAYYLKDLNNKSAINDFNSNIFLEIQFLRSLLEKVTNCIKMLVGTSPLKAHRNNWMIIYLQWNIKLLLTLLHPLRASSERKSPVLVSFSISLLLIISLLLLSFSCLRLITSLWPFMINFWSEFRRQLTDFSSSNSTIA